jgi:hypothetical protein
MTWRRGGEGESRRGQLLTNTDTTIIIEDFQRCDCWGRKAAKRQQAHRDGIYRDHVLMPTSTKDDDGELVGLAGHRHTEYFGPAIVTD